MSDPSTGNTYSERAEVDTVVQGVALTREPRPQLRDKSNDVEMRRE